MAKKEQDIYLKKLTSMRTLLNKRFNELDHRTESINFKIERVNAQTMQNANKISDLSHEMLVFRKQMDQKHYSQSRLLKIEGSLRDLSSDVVQIAQAFRSLEAKIDTLTQQEKPQKKSIFNKLFNR